jgi:hypothetical protein
MCFDEPQLLIVTHRDDGNPLMVRAAEKLTAFLELESVTRIYGELCLTLRRDSREARRR